MRLLGNQHGYRPIDPHVEYESDWYFATVNNHILDGKQAFRAPWYSVSCNAEAKLKTMEAASKLLTQLDKKWSDGRKFVAGESLTIADFDFLGLTMSLLDNPYGMNPEINLAMRTEVMKNPNVSRMIAGHKIIFKSFIGSQPHRFI